MPIVKFYTGERIKLPSFFKKKQEKNNPLGENKEDLLGIVKEKGMQISSEGKAKFLKGLGAGGGVILGIATAFAIIFFLVVVRPALALGSNLGQLKKDVANLQKSFIDRDLVLFEKTLVETKKNLGDVKEARDKHFGWVRNLPLAKGYYLDSEHFIDAGLHGVKAGEEFAVVIAPFADAVGLKTEKQEGTEQTQQTQGSGLAEAFSTWISVMPEVAQDIDGVLSELALVGEELSKVDASRYPKKIRGVPLRDNIVIAQKTLTTLNENASDIKKALEIIPGLLGVGTGEKRYVIIMQNDGEIRATGGFWTFYSTFKISNALLTSDFTSKDMYSIDHTLEVIDPYHTFPAVPPVYYKHLKVERMFARDANISPDFPTTMDQWMYFYKLAMQVAPWEIKPIDGVIAIDTRVVKELLEVTGPVTVNGVTFSSDNVVLELEKIASLSLAEQANRKKVLGDLMEGMLINVFESDKSLWSQLIEKGIDLANRKHVLVYMFSPDAQALLEKYNLAGRIVDPVKGDFAYVVSTNLGGDKTNLFVTKKVEHELAKLNDRWARTVKITYTYNNAPSGFEPLVKRFQEWVRLYVPAGSELMSVDGSQDETGKGEEMNKKYFHGWVTMGPGESCTITFKYYLPAGVVGDKTYDLYIEKQPGVDKETHTVTVSGKTETIDLTKDYQYSKAF